LDEKQTYPVISAYFLSAIMTKTSESQLGVNGVEKVYKRKLHRDVHASALTARAGYVTLSTHVASALGYHIVSDQEL
jgi:hypothetical protein